MAPVTAGRSRCLYIVVALIVVWQIYSWWLDDSLLFPGITESAGMFWNDLRSGLLLNCTVFADVLWAVAFNTLSGFRGVPETLRMSGRNLGLRGARYVGLLLIPAAFPSILAGLKIGWAFGALDVSAAETVAVGLILALGLA